MKEMSNAACPHIEGMRIDDLIAFLTKHKLEAYLPVSTRNGKPPKYDRQWLLNVRTLLFLIHTISCRSA